jgi:hypothetical protein
VASGLITLTTDFGWSDHYVGVVKGVIWGMNPAARLADLCHAIEPYDLVGAALILAASYPYFPEGTVHLVVVDPGVGSARRAILAEAARSLFVAPDNGVLELVYQRERHVVRALRTEKFALQPTSNTFHARDVFAPAAALLSRGIRPDSLGEPIEDYVRLDIPRPRRLGEGRLEGRVLRVDRFGNLITNLEPADLPAAFQITIGNTRIGTLLENYAAAREGEVFAIEGSSGYIEISRKQASAAAALGAGPGTPLELRT